MRFHLTLSTCVAAALLALGCERSGQGQERARSDSDLREVQRLTVKVQPSSPSTRKAARPHEGPTDITFFVISDTHFGAEGLLERNGEMVRQLNALPGKAYPRKIGGTVGRPLGVLHAGDITDWGTAEQWQQFVEHYGRTGKDGKLAWAMFETVGNHDLADGRTTVIDAVKKRHGQTHYSWDFQGVRMICLGLYPTLEARKFLRDTLRAIGPSHPVVLYFHYGLSGPFSDWWKEPEKEAFGKTIKGYYILGIFHGHYHSSHHYRWNGYDVYLIGSPRHSTRRLLAVHITDDRMTVAAWDWARRQWDWTHAKKVRAAKEAPEAAATAAR